MATKQLVVPSIRFHNHLSVSPTDTGSSSNESIQVTKTSTSSSVASQSVYNQESVDATVLVDELLRYTRSLMNNGSSTQKNHIIAYSGGIDSSLVASLIHQSQRENEEVVAVLGLSPAVPSEQVALAEEVAKVIGVSLEKISTTEGTDDVYIQNSGQACLACKTHLYSCLGAIAEHTSRRQPLLYNGTNADDVMDPTRLGLTAADRFQVQSPLRHTPKDMVRVAGKHLGLPNWNYAASPCLRSRLALGVEAIPQHLKRIEEAERYIRKSLELDVTRNLRVRLLSKKRAMIEVEAEILDDAKSLLEKSWQKYFQTELEFSSVDVRGFKSGSVAKVVVPPNDEQHDQVELSALRITY